LPTNQPRLRIRESLSGLSLWIKSVKVSTKSIRRLKHECNCRLNRKIKKTKDNLFPNASGQSCMKEYTETFLARKLKMRSLNLIKLMKLIKNDY